MQQRRVKLNIYDRWGDEVFKKVYHATSQSKIPDGAVQWDGFQRCNDINKILWCTCENIEISWPISPYAFWIDFENCDNSYGGDGLIKGDVQLSFPTGQSLDCTKLIYNNCQECK